MDERSVIMMITFFVLVSYFAVVLFADIAFFRCIYLGDNILFPFNICKSQIFSTIWGLADSMNILI